MGLTVVAFLALLVVVAMLRGVELLISRRHQRILEAQGVHKARDPSFTWMVIVHTGILTGAALEVVFFQRRLMPVLALAAGTLFVVANIVRWWVILTLGDHWNVHVMNSAPLGVITGGPFRLVRHPNYAAVFIELATLPLIHTAWLTAVIGAAGHAWVLSRRLAIEDPVLLGSPAYQATMADKPRFVPRFVRGYVGGGSRTAAVRPDLRDSGTYSE
jgi:methyltransferase